MASSNIDKRSRIRSVYQMRQQQHRIETPAEMKTFDRPTVCGCVPNVAKHLTRLVDRNDVEAVRRGATNA